MKNLIMDEYFKALMQIFVPIISSVLAAGVAWALRGKYENKKAVLEMEQIALNLRREEVEFRDKLMIQVRQLQEQVFNLEKIVHNQALQLEQFQHVIDEKDELIKTLTNESNSKTA